MFNRLISGFSQKIHIPKSLDLDSHTTAGAGKSQGVMGSIMRRVSFHWTDTEANKRVLEQKGKIMNALKEIKKAHPEIVDSNNVVGTDNKAYNTTYKQLEKIERLIQEIETWEKKKEVKTTHVFHGSNAKTYFKNLETAVVGPDYAQNLNLDSQTYKSGEALKEMLNKKFTPKKITQEEIKQLRPILNANFFDVEQLEKAFSTVQTILEKKGEPVTELNVIRSKFEGSLPDHIQKFIKELPTRTFGKELSAQQTETLKIAYKILNRPDLSNKDKDQLFECAQVIIEFKHTEGTNEKGRKTTLYGALQPQSREIVNDMLEKINRGDTFSSVDHFNKAMGNTLAAMELVADTHHAGKNLKAFIAPHIAKGNPSIEPGEMAKLKKIQETEFTNVEQFSAALNTTQAIFKAVENRVHRGPYNQAWVDPNQQKFGKFYVQHEQFYRQNPGLDPAQVDLNLIKLQKEYNEFVPDNIRAFRKSIGEKPTTVQAELLKYAAKIENRQDLSFKQREELFEMVQQAIPYTVKGNNRGIGANGQLMDLRDTLSETNKKNIKHILARILDDVPYKNPKKFEIDIGLLGQATAPAPLQIKNYMDQQMRSIRNPATQTIPKREADLLKMAHKITQRHDLNPKQKDRLFALARLFHKLKNGESIDYVTPTTKKKMEELFQNIEKEKTFTNEKGLLTKLEAIERVIAQLKNEQTDPFLNATATRLQSPSDF